MIWFLETAISDNWFKSLIRDSPNSNPHFYIGMCGGVRAEAILKSGDSGVERSHDQRFVEIE